MKKVKIKLVLVCTFIIAVLYILYFPVKLEVELVATYNAEGIEKSHWKTICDQNDELLNSFKNINKELSDFDFKKNNLIISYGDEIKSISYKRISYFQHPLNEAVYLGKAEYGTRNDNIIYLYKIKKVNVIYNIFTDPL